MCGKPQIRVFPSVTHLLLLLLQDATMQHMIRYNDAVHDPISTLGCGTNPPYSYTNAIADRSDLNAKKGDYVIGELGHGDSAGVDAKVRECECVALLVLTSQECRKYVLIINLSSMPYTCSSLLKCLYTRGLIRAVIAIH